MDTLKQQILKDKDGHKIGVFIPMEDYDKIVEQLEELEDIKAYDIAITENQKYRPLKEAINDIEKKRRAKKV